jgi:hypothetical protein
MKMKYLKIALLLAVLLCRIGYCGKAYMSANTKVDITIKTPISTKDQKPSSLKGIIEIASADSSAGVEIFRKGGQVFGRIVEFAKAGNLGKPGALRIILDSLETVQGKIVAIKPLPLSAVGKGKKLKAYLMLPLFGAGYFVKGSDAILEARPEPITVQTAKFEEITF